MDSPTFSYAGGKSRLRDWLMQFFPYSGENYIEPFAGLGNVFFLTKGILNFNNWWLNDIQTYSFFMAVQNMNFDELPEKVDYTLFLKLKANRNNYLSIILEPYITYGGKGYDYGFLGEHHTIGYSKSKYVWKLTKVKSLLENVKITNLLYDEINYNELTNKDFVYFDPPYYGTNIGNYPNINHEKLLMILKNANFRWVISSYDNDFYKSLIGSPYKSIHSICQIAQNTKAGKKREECVWVSKNLL